jgi:hypothetical protein
MSGIRRAGLGLFWGLCALSVVALYASAAVQFARLGGETILHWVGDSASAYAVPYAPMHGS